MSDKTLKQKQQRQDKEKQAYAFYVAQGWTPEQAIGIVGNLIRESNLNTSIVGTADDKGSQGLAQWHSGRLKTLKDRYGEKWTDFKNQLEFIDWELKNTEKRAGDRLKNSKGVWESAKIFSDEYERPKVKYVADDTRQKNVANTAIKFKGIKLTPEDMPYYGATYTNSVAPYMGEQKEMVTPILNYFDVSKEIANFASVPDSAQKEDITEKIDKDVEEVESKTKEYNFLEELQKEDYSYLQPEQVAQQQTIPQVDFNQQFEQVSQFIDNPVAQEGLTWQEKLTKRPKKPTVAEIIAEGDKRKVQQRAQTDNTKVSNYNDARLFNPNVRNKTDKEIAQERESKIQASVEAQKAPYTKENWRQQLAAETAATGDKLRVSLEPNFFDDYINPAAMIGNMASNLGQAPLQAQQTDSVMPYATAIGAPLAVGALAGIGAKTTGQFANNIVNPLAGTGDLVNNLGNKYLPNAYKLNPTAFKPDSKMGYRMLGKDGFDDAIETGVLRAKPVPNQTLEGISLARNTNRNPNTGKMQGALDRPYFADGIIDERYAADYMAAVNKAENNLVPIATHKGIAPSKAGSIPLENATLYKKDWLQGYKEVPKPTSNFNSEINWGNWNKEIPDNLQLMKEYNAIEQTSKANGSWMKNPDGSVFQGTPEQFVQQNSENFKKYFDKSKLVNSDGSPTIVYHGSPNQFESFDKFQITDQGFHGRGIYTTPKKGYAQQYAGDISSKNPTPTLYELYGNTVNPATTREFREGLHEFNKGNNIEKNFLNYDSAVENLNYKLGEESFPIHKAREIVFPKSNQVKSATGNNGMFDMNNPNIYKSVAPIAGASYLATQENRQQGGTVKEDKDWLQNWYQNRVIPDEVIQNEYFLPQQKDYVNRAKNLKDPKVVDQVTSPDGMPVEGVTRANGDIELSKNSAPHVQLHEMAHSINKYPFLMRDIHESVVKQNIAPIEGINNEDVKKYYDYFSDPEEVHARIQVLRKEAKIKPDQKVTPEFLQNYLKTYKGGNSNINDLLNIADEPHLLEMLNYMADAPKSKEKEYVAQQGGQFTENELAFLSEIAIKDNEGQYRHPGKITEIEGGNITMKNVPYDMLGIGIKNGKKTEQKRMKSNKNYNFKNVDSVIEIPFFKK